MSAETFFEEPHLLDSLVAFDETTDGELIMQTSQELPDDWLSEIAKQKVDSANHKMGDFYHVASIPADVIVYIKNIYGLDIMAPGVKFDEIKKALERYSLDHFILTTKTI